MTIHITSLMRAAASAALFIAGPSHAQPAASPAADVHARYASVPFAVGEELVFHATFGKLPAGTARMRVQGIDTIRGRPAYHVAFAIDGGILFFRVHDTYESWIDVETLSSLRHKQSISEGRYPRRGSSAFTPATPCATIGISSLERTPWSCRECAKTRLPSARAHS